MIEVESQPLNADRKQLDTMPWLKRHLLIVCEQFALLWSAHSSIRATSATFSGCAAAAAAHRIIAFNQTLKPVPFTFKGFPPPVRAQPQRTVPQMFNNWCCYIYRGKKPYKSIKIVKLNSHKSALVTSERGSLQLGHTSWAKVSRSTLNASKSGSRPDPSVTKSWNI